MRLETERLLLRPYEAGDKDAVSPIFADAVVRRFYPAVLSPHEVSAMVDRTIALAAANGFHFGVATLRGTGEMVGHIGIGVVPDDTRAAIPGHPRVEVGWVFAQRFWGRGLAPEGARAWLAYAWEALDLPEVVAFTARINLPSQRVMQKLGMHHEAADTFDHPNVPPGHPLRPHVVYRIANPRRLSSA